MYRCAKIGDYVWVDSGMEANVQDIGDVGIDGVVIELYKNTQPWNPIQSVVSYLNPLNNGSGYYEFKVCETGTYYIKVLLGNEYDFVIPNQEPTDTLDSDIVDIINGTSLSFELGYAEIITQLDIGIKFKPLPVTLLYFEGRRNAAISVNELKWSTSQEINNDYFKIKRSLNGKAYEELGVVQGQGTSAGPTEYTYTDADTAQPGVYFYKLIQVDYDGKAKEYGPISIQVGATETMVTNIYPNPTGNYSTLKIEAPVGTLISGSLVDMSGKRIRDIWIDEVSRTESTEIILDTQDLKKGVYHIQLIINGTVKTLKWLVLE
jgi:SdrD B-like domain/Secretion system C-terminal sorting domain